MKRDTDLTTVTASPDSVALIFSQRVFIMGLAIVSIMLFHQYFCYQYFIDCKPLKLFTKFGHFGVDVFFFVSGMGIALSLARNSLSSFFVNRVSRLIPAWLLVTALTYALLPGSKSAEGFLCWLFHLWFLNTLVLFYTLSPLLRLFVLRWGIGGIVVAAAACAVFLCFRFIAPWRIELAPEWRQLVDWSLFRLPVYMLGLYCGAKGRAVASSRLWSLGWAVPLFAVAVAMRLMVEYRWLTGGNYWFADGCLYFFLAFAIPCICLYLARLGQLVSASRLHAVACLLGTCSLELYLWHEWLYGKAYCCMVQYAWEGWLCLAGAMVLSLLLAWGTHWLCARGMSLLEASRGR